LIYWPPRAAAAGQVTARRRKRRARRLWSLVAARRSPLAARCSLLAERQRRQATIFRRNQAQNKRPPLAARTADQQAGCSRSRSQPAATLETWTGKAEANQSRAEPSRAEPSRVGLRRRKRKANGFQANVFIVATRPSVKLTRAAPNSRASLLRAPVSLLAMLLRNTGNKQNINCSQ